MKETKHKIKGDEEVGHQKRKKERSKRVCICKKNV